MPVLDTFPINSLDHLGILCLRNRERKVGRTVVLQESSDTNAEPPSSQSKLALSSPRFLPQRHAEIADQQPI